MKPNFALTLSFETIGLLHRTSRGWMPIGEVPTDSPDLAEALSYLRSSALGLSTQGMTCKIVLPASEILYTEVACASDDPEMQLAAVRTALDGMTPYPVDDLVFDVAGEAPRLQVAVTARETLDQAEAFAVEHRFNPVSLVALPPEGRFAGEPFFGETAAADGLLTGDSAVERDSDPLVVVTQAQGRDGGGRPGRKGNRAERRAAAAAVSAEARPVPAEPQAALTLADVTAVPPAEPPAADPPVASDTAPEGGADGALAAEAVAPEAVAIGAAATEAVAPEMAVPDVAELAQNVPDHAEPEPQVASVASPDAAPTPAATEAAPPDDPNPEQAGVTADPTPLPPAPVEMPDPEDAAPDADPVPPIAAAPVPSPVEDLTPSDAADEEPVEAEAPFIEVEGDPEMPADLPLRVAPPPPPPEAPKLGAMPAFSSRRRETPTSEPKVAAPEPAPDAATEPAPAPSLLASDPPPAAPRLRPDTFDPPAPLKPRAAPPALDSAPAAPRGPAIGPAAAPATPSPAIKPATGPTARTTGDLLSGVSVLASAAQPVSKIPAALRAPGAAGPRGDDPGRKPARGKVAPPSGQATAALPAGKRPSGKVQVLDQSAMAGRPPNASPLRPPVKPVGGKPRYLGLVLTGILLLFLAVVAAWSSMVLSRRGDDTAETRVVELPPPEAEATPLAPPAPVEVSAGDPAAAPEPTPPVPAPQIAPEPDAETASDIAEAADLPQPESEPVAAAEPEPEAATPPPAAAAAQQGAQTRPLPRPGETAGSEIQLSALDAPPPAFDALALPTVAATPDTAPAAPMAPPPEGTTYTFDDQGRIAATERGVVTPDGVWLIAARPPLIPPPRPTSTEAASTEPAAAAPAAVEAAVAEAAAAPGEPVAAASAFQPDAQVNARRPRARPDGLVRPADPPAQQAEDDAALPGSVDTRLALLRPRARPAAILTDAPARASDSDAASLVLAASQAPPAATVFAGASPLAVPISRRPATRPQDFSKAVAAAVAAATAATPAPAPAARAPEPEDEAEPEPVASPAPRIPTKADVARQATFANAINLSKLNLIGIYSTSSSRYALVRTSTGRYSKVNVGDRLDGGQVVAITGSEVRYQKGGRVVALTMPKG